MRATAALLGSGGEGLNFRFQLANLKKKRKKKNIRVAGDAIILGGVERKRWRAEEREETTEGSVNEGQDMVKDF